jgi:hypothetical protein
VNRAERGIILIALLIAMVVIAVLIAALSAINITGFLSGPLYVGSTQAFYTAQAGAEYGLRYATDNSSSFCADPAALFSALGTVSFGNGKFTLVYDKGLNRLTAQGQVGDARRTITIDSFDSFLPGCGLIVLDPALTPYRSGTGTSTRVYYQTINNASCTLRITSIGLAKNNGVPAQVSQLYFASTRVWNSNVWISANSSSPTVLNTTDYNMVAHAVRLNYIRVRATAQASGTWYVTYYYNDCSGKASSSTIAFSIP